MARITSGMLNVPPAKGGSTVWLRFYAELNDHLPMEQRFGDSPHCIESRAEIGDIIEQCGIPLAEVDLILANGESVDSFYEPEDGDRVSVYPVFESFDISPVTKVRRSALRVSRFVLDVHLGKLAYYLRMLGFDTLYRNDYNDEDLVRLSVDEERILLSKDRELLADDRVQRGYRVRENNPRRQIAEVMRRFDLSRSCSPLQRCIRCNVLLEPADKHDVLDRLPPRIAGAFHEFQQCSACQRVYWRGSHYESMMAFIGGLLNAGATISDPL